jgi:type II secretory pathway pseudopilin PulG
MLFTNLINSAEEQQALQAANEANANLVSSYQAGGIPLTHLSYPATQNLTTAKEIVTRFFKDRYNYRLLPISLESEAQSWVDWSKKDGHPYPAFVNHWDKPENKPESNITNAPQTTGPVEGMGNSLTSPPVMTMGPTPEIPASTLGSGTTTTTEETETAEETHSLFGSEVSSSTYYMAIAGAVLAVLGIAFLAWKKLK